ncbi:MAG TPA: glycosyl hydrolase family 18 protein [Mycobacteriales bacterium]|nr:glycosyl hydrolase family 18 protein [Mycobacteriales bacterium]
MRTLRAALAVGAAALVVGAGLLVAAGPAGAVELVANPGFESGPTPAGWTCTAETGIGTPARTGTRALVGTPTSTTAECAQTIPVQAGAAYTLTAWVRGAYVFLGASGTSAGEVSTWTPGTAGAYSQLTVRFTGGSTPVRIWVHGWYGQGTYQADDVSLQGPGTTPPPPTNPPTTTPPTTPPTTTPPTSPPPTNPPGTGALPRHTLTGYWHNFVNGSSNLRLRDVPATYDVVDVAFADATTTPGAVSFAVDPGLSSALGGYTDANLIADVATLHARGAKVVLSVGGQNGTISVSDSTSATNFATSMRSILSRFGFDGVDIDLENGVNPTFMAQALHSIAAGRTGFILTMAPQTIDMQSTGTAYFQLALNVRDILTTVHTQYYNSGTMLGCDGRVYAQGTVDFITALACIQLQGGLRPDQVAIGLPASSRAAGGGAVAPSVVTAALTCLAQGVGCGSFHPPTTWPSIRGAMTWSVNWDQVQGYAFANTVAPALDRLP